MGEAQAVPPEEQERIAARIAQHVGRNVLLFQQLESQCKLLLSACVRSGTLDELQYLGLRHDDDVALATLGQVIRRLGEQVFATPPEMQADASAPDAIRVKFTHTFEPHPDRPRDLPDMVDRWLKLVVERNELVHHFLDRWPAGSRIDALPSLDAQADAIKRAIAEVRSFLASHQAMAERLATPEMQRSLAQSLLAGAALERAVELAERARGRGDWLHVSAVLSSIGQEPLLRAAREAGGVGRGEGWLLDLLRSQPGTFEVTTEPRPGGGTLNRYRLRAAAATPTRP